MGVTDLSGSLGSLGSLDSHCREVFCRLVPVKSVLSFDAMVEE